MTASNTILKFVYSLFLGVLLALFVGFGINTFYEGPKEPRQPIVTEPITKEPTEEQRAADIRMQNEYRKYDDQMKPYSRNVSIIALTAAVIFLSLSLVFEKKLRMLADGIMFGGLFTLLYSIIRSVISQDSTYIFIVITIGLITVLYLGYHKFIRHTVTDETDATESSQLNGPRPSQS